MLKARILGCALLGALVLGAPSAFAADTHWLNFNPYAYTHEFFAENGTTVGSCGAAAVVLVESHIQLKESIPTGAVKLKNNSVKSCPSTYFDGSFYISSLTCLKGVLEADGYTVVNRTTANRSTAVDRIFAALASKHWVIILSRYSFSTTSNLGHFYPVYGGNRTGSNFTSTLNVIEDLNSAYSPTNPNWNVMYRTQVNLDQILNSMKSASSLNYYNILEVYKP